MYVGISETDILHPAAAREGSMGMSVIDQSQFFALPEPVSAFLHQEHRLLIDGQWVPAASGEEFDVVDPSTGAVVCRVPKGSAEDVNRAVVAARRAFDSGPWSRMSGADRAKLIWRLADALEARVEDFAILESVDNGKPIGSAKGDMLGSIAHLRYYAGWAGKIGGETIPSQRPGNFHSYTLREPIGVVGAITPWNYPLMMTMWKLAPALAAGCTVILKPPEQTPLSTLWMGELVQAAGFPDGVVNIVSGYGDAGAALVEHPGVDKIAFTGSTVTGKTILRSAAMTLKRVSLELGGKSPTVILPDADLSLAIPGAARSIFSNSGQVCVAGSRLFAHRTIFDQVVDGIAAAATHLKVGPGLAPETEIGPLVSDEQFARVTGYLRTGVDEGAEVVVGGKAVDRPGYFVEPTVLAKTNRDMTVRQEEIFGPVLCVMSFDDDDLAAIAAEANDTIYGLSAYIWTQNLSAAHKLAKLIKAGTVNINGGGADAAVPFGGYKQSGWGREHGREGIEIYTELKSVSINLG